jgi:magnesium transporter
MALPRVEEKEKKLNVESITWESLTWVNIEGPTEREMQYLAQNYPFHRLDLDDCLSRTQRQKIDEYPDYIFSILHFQVFNKATKVSTHTQLSVFIGKNYLVTIHTGELKALVKLFKQCQTEEETRRENFIHGSGYLLYRVLDRLVDSYFPILDKILLMMENVEDKVFDENVEAAQELALLRRDVITQRRINFPLRTVLASLEGKLKRFTDIDMSVYWGDLMDHMNKICDTLDEIKETVEVYKDTDFVLSTERLNRVSRVLTIFGAIMLPFLIISSIYGMNVIAPGGIEATGSHRTFIVLLIVMSGIAGIMLFIFRRRRWI